MKKTLLLSVSALLMLTACTNSAPSSKEVDSSSASTSQKDSNATVDNKETVQAGATDSGKGGLNYGDVDWSENLKKEAVNTYLSGIGGNHREMMQVATVSQGNPQIASVEYYMDTTNHWFFGTSESDTGKIQDMKVNPNVALYWTRQLRASDMTMAPNYFTSYGVEVQGEAKFYTVDQVNASTNKSELISIARGYYQSMGAQYKKFYDSTAEGYLDDAAFTNYVYGSKTQTAYIIQPKKIIITSPYLLFVSRIEDETKADGHYYAFQQGKMTLSEYTFLPKSFLDKCLEAVRTAKNDNTLMKFTSMKADFSGATGLKTQVKLEF